MTLFGRSTSAALFGLAGIFCIGCGQDVDQDDLTSAREQVLEEERETQIARQEAAENIAEEERETAEARRKVMEPDLSDLREEEKETAEAREEAEKTISKEERETLEAKQKLAEIEAKLSAQRARDSYLTERELLLTTATLEIEKLKKAADDQEGAVKETTEKQIEQLEEAHENLADSIAAMKNANPLQWKIEKPATEAAYEELQRLLKDSAS